MSDSEAIKWLEECAQYFSHRPTNGEDKAHWSNAYNAENALKVAGLLRADLTPTDAQIMAHPKVQALVEALKCAVQDFYEMANKIDDEDYVGTPDGCNATVYGHFKKYRKMHVDYCIKAADRALAALEYKP